MADEKPWPQLPLGNKDHANGAVVIIGAGVSGLCTAIDLVKRNGCRNFLILEKSAGVGGTWHDNKYPGCCCDVWSTLYSYSFAQNPDWTREYPGQEEILAYLVKVAEEYRLYQHIRFNTTVDEATWDDAAQKWKIQVSTASGSKEAEFNANYEITTDFLVSGVGQLNQPKWPEIEGVREFKGKLMHSARWDWSYDLKDKRIAILGNGCTAVQILPEIAPVAKHVTVFQRTPNWVVPRADAPVSPLMRTLYKYVPPIRWRNRSAKMDFRESTHSAVTDNKSDMAVLFRDMGLQMMKSQLPDQPELWEKLTPNYSVGCKRIIISDDFYPTLGLPHVDLETRKIHSVAGNNVKILNERSEPVDALDEGYDLLVCATGFKTVQFMHPIKITGHNGRSLSDVWKDGAQAFYGVGVEDMPNFGMLYGPNTNLGHNSIILMIEAQSRYINGLIKPVLDARKAGKTLSLRPKKSKVDEYNATVQAELRNSSFNDPNCQSWYKNEQGVITNNWSRTVVAYQKMLETLDFNEYEVEGTASAEIDRNSAVKIPRVREESLLSDAAIAALGVLGAVATVGGIILRNPAYRKAIGIK